MDTTKHRTMDVAQGRWTEVLLALGVPAKVLNHKNQPCPGCGGKDRFRFTDHGANGSYFCSKCGAGNGIKLLCMVRGWDWKQAYHEVNSILGNLPPTPPVSFGHGKASSPGICRRLYADSTQIAEADAAWLYLRKRGLLGTDDEMSVFRKVLRHVPSMRYHADRSFHPGMVAVFSDADGRPATLHRTYLTTDGNKAALVPNRMFMAGSVPAGGAIRLSAPNEDITCLGIAEGIETALACRMLRSGLPVWATTGEALMRSWRPPAEAKDITIFADNDMGFVGQAAAYALAQRLWMESRRDGLHRRIIVEVPPHPGTDFNDVLLAEQMASSPAERDKVEDIGEGSE